MSLTDEQRYQLNKLIDCRDEITQSIFHIEQILKVYFPEEFELGIQFYIPQITTALYENKKWLSRGDYSLQNTIDHLVERCKNNNTGKGTQKYF